MLAIDYSADLCLVSASLICNFKTIWLSLALLYITVLATDSAHYAYEIIIFLNGKYSKKAYISKISPELKKPQNFNKNPEPQIKQKNPRSREKTALATLVATTFTKWGKGPIPDGLFHWMRERVKICQIQKTVAFMNMMFRCTVQRWARTGLDRTAIFF